MTDCIVHCLPEVQLRSRHPCILAASPKCGSCLRCTLWGGSLEASMQCALCSLYPACHVYRLQQDSVCVTCWAACHIRRLSWSCKSTSLACRPLKPRGLPTWAVFSNLVEQEVAHAINCTGQGTCRKSAQACKPMHCTACGIMSQIECL